MKLTLSLLQFLTTALLAQSVPAPLSACGPGNPTYRYETSDDATIPAPSPGMATLILIEDQLRVRPGHPLCIRCTYQVHLGMDGQWIAATNGFSHTSILIAPGDHHFCAQTPSAILAPLPSMYGLHVEAGRTYFLRAKLTLHYGDGAQTLDLSEPNEDEARYLVSQTKQIKATKK